MKNIRIKAYSVNKKALIDKKSSENSISMKKGNTSHTNNLNIFSKMDSKGNGSININLFEKQVKKRSSIKENDVDGNSKERIDQKPNIEIKLNINSEVINNNYKISKEDPKKKTQNKNSFKENETLNYYKDQLEMKDKMIEELKEKIREVNKLIAKNSDEVDHFTIESIENFKGKDIKKSLKSELLLQKQEPSDNFRRNSKANLTIKENENSILKKNKKSNTHSMSKPSKTIEDILKSTVKLIEKSIKNEKEEIQSKKNFSHNVELQKLKNRVHTFFENFSKNIFTPPSN